MEDYIGHYVLRRFQIITGVVNLGTSPAIYWIEHLIVIMSWQVDKFVLITMWQVDKLVLIMMWRDDYPKQKKKGNRKKNKSKRGKPLFFYEKRTASKGGGPDPQPYLTPRRKEMRGGAVVPATGRPAVVRPHGSRQPRPQSIEREWERGRSIEWDQGEGAVGRPDPGYGRVGGGWGPVSARTGGSRPATLVAATRIPCSRARVLGFGSSNSTTKSTLVRVLQLGFEVGLLFLLFSVNFDEHLSIIVVQVGLELIISNLRKLWLTLNDA